MNGRRTMQVTVLSPAKVWWLITKSQASLYFDLEDVCRTFHKRNIVVRVASYHSELLLLNPVRTPGEWVVETWVTCVGTFNSCDDEAGCIVDSSGAQGGLRPFFRGSSRKYIVPGPSCHESVELPPFGNVCR